MSMSYLPNKVPKGSSSNKFRQLCPQAWHNLNECNYNCLEKIRTDGKTMPHHTAHQTTSKW